MRIKAIYSMSQIGNCHTTEIRSYDKSPKQTQNIAVK